MPKDLGKGFVMEDEGSEKDLGSGFTMEAAEPKDLGGGFTMEGTSGAGPATFNGTPVPGTERTGLPQPAFKPPTLQIQNSLLAPATPAALGFDPKSPQDVLPRANLSVPRKIIGGIAELASPSTPSMERRAHGASQAIRGTFEAATPIAAPAVLANPITALGALGGTAALGHVAADETKAEGFQPGYADLLTDALSGVGGLVGGITASQAAPSVAALARSVRGARTVNPAIELAKAANPPKHMTNWEEDVSIAQPHIEAGAGKPIKSHADLMEGISNAEKAAADALEKNYLAPARAKGTRFSGDAIVKATEKAVEPMRRENPQEAEALVEQARRAYGGQNFDVDQMKGFLTQKNAELHPHYAKRNSMQVSTELAAKPASVVKAQRDAVAQGLYEGLDPIPQPTGKMKFDAVRGKEVPDMRPGQGPRQIQDVYHRLLNVEEAFEGKGIDVLRQQPSSPWEGRKQQLQMLANIPGRLFHGHLGGKFEALSGPSRIGDVMTGDINARIARAFEVPSGRAAAFPGGGSLTTGPQPKGVSVGTVQGEPPPVAQQPSIANLTIRTGPRPTPPEVLRQQRLQRQAEFINRAQGNQAQPPGMRQPPMGPLAPEEMAPKGVTPAEPAMGPTAEDVSQVKALGARRREGASPPPIQQPPAPPAGFPAHQTPGAAQSLHNLYQLMRSPEFVRMNPQYKASLRQQAEMLAEQLSPEEVKAIRAPFIHAAPPRLTQPIKINRVDAGI